MTSLADVCDLIRSKNAGPFWTTIDLFFADGDVFSRYMRDPALDARAIARLYGLDASQVRHYYVENLRLLKISFPRLTPQGGADERDLHGGQQYVRLLAVRLDDSPAASD